MMSNEGQTSQPDKPLYGGLAVVEGVMMRSPNYWSIACRAPNGQIIVKTEHVEKTWIGRQKWLMKPFLRGTFAMLDTMALGVKAMNWAGTVQADPKYMTEEERAKLTKKEEKGLTSTAIVLTVISSLALGFALFNFLPQAVAEVAVRLGGGNINRNDHLTLTNYVAEIIKLIFIIGYLWAISLWEPIRNTFRYHGAEHKAINAMEDQLELTPDNVLSRTRLHPRCGTNFVIIVFVVSFLLQPLIPRDLFVPATSPAWLITLTRLPVELAMVPIISGISYELIRLAGRAKNQAWVKVALWPGLQTQLITTAEPRQDHVEVAIAALTAAREAEAGEPLFNGIVGEEPTIANETVIS